nr:phage tail protein [Enterobacter roggenkampii]
MTAINSPPLCRGGRIFTDFAMCNRFSKNLGLGEGSALPVGVPVPWPSATPPAGWLKCNGAAFTASQYPKLAQAYPALILPDLRGEFIRGWDDSRGVDSGRSLLSAQGDAIRNITGRVDNAVTSAKNSYLGAMQYQGSSYISVQSGGVNVDAMNISFDASRIVPTASENRPRNIAFNYIVRAA